MSEFREIVAKLRDYEIRIRKAINTQMHGDFHSVFKGSGLEFDDVRSYQYGDDVRHIDWNVTAKGHGTFVKTFKEEKEQNIFFLLDVSASQNIGKKGHLKIDIAKEIVGVLTLSALKESSSVGLLCFSDEKERYVKPNKGTKHAYQIIQNIYKLVPQSLGTNLTKAMGTVLNMVKRKSMIIIVSDFVDEGYEHNLKAIARKHDLIVIHIGDDRETKFPEVGIVPLYDKESRKTVWMNTSSKEFRNKLDHFYAGNREAIKNLCLRNNGSYLFVNTKEDYIPKLIKLFKVRNTARRK